MTEKVSGSAPEKAVSIIDSVGKAVSFFERVQLNSGEFETVAAADHGLTEGRSADSTPFTTSFLLHAFSFYRENSIIERVAEKAVAFLISQSEGPGIWRYWTKENEKHRTFPPDLDDTCCISSALKIWGVPVKDITNVISENRDENGLFYTWLVQRKKEMAPAVKEILSPLIEPAAVLNLLQTGKFNNIDAAVIANVMMFTGDCEMSRASGEFLVKLVTDKRVEEYTTYYPDLFTLYYMISRAYFYGVNSFAPLTETISESVLKYLRSSESKSLQKRAISLCILHNFNRRDSIEDRFAEEIISEQQPGGQWRGETLFLGPAPYYGSDELTSSFCFEALVRLL